MDLARALGLEGPALAAFVGAGGKKTAMARLVEEAGARGRSAGYTTTTHVPPPELPLIVSEPDDLGVALEDADPPVAFAREWVAQPERADRKLRGFPPAVVDRIYRRGQFDWLLVKADGARRREFKAPGPDEPALPEETTLVVPVAAVTAVGAPLSTAQVHRVDRVAALTGLAPGDELDAEAVGTVLASPEGGLKGVPSEPAVAFLVNKADTPALQETAKAVLAHAFERTDRPVQGVVTSFTAGYCERVAPGDGA